MLQAALFPPIERLILAPNQPHGGNVSLRYGWRAQYRNCFVVVLEGLRHEELLHFGPAVLRESDPDPLMQLLSQFLGVFQMRLEHFESPLQEGF